MKTIYPILAAIHYAAALLAALLFAFALGAVPAAHKDFAREPEQLQLLLLWGTISGTAAVILFFLARGWRARLPSVAHQLSAWVAVVGSLALTATLFDSPDRIDQLIVWWALATGASGAALLVRKATLTGPQRSAQP